MGYIVAALSVPLLNLENSLLVVQSPATDEARVIKEIDSLLDAQDSVSADNLVLNQQSLIKKLQEPARSLKEQSERYWNSITTHDEDFSRREALIAAVANITPESLNHFYKTIFLDKNRRLWLTSDALDARDGFTEIQDLSAYKNQMGRLAQP